MNEIRRIIVIGASAGGFSAITTLVSTIPDGMPVAIFIVLHMAKASSAEIIQEHLQRHTNYTCRIPQDGEPVKAGHIYLAPPNVHMLVKPGIVRLVKGAHENRWRPSIDVLFRSAAVVYNSGVIGVILSGLLDDGTSGMLAIKRCGGICIVQEPSEAQYPDMPNSVLNSIEVDYRVPIADMGYITDDLFSKALPPHAVPENVRIEAEITERITASIAEINKLGTHSNLTCPDCGGALWLIGDEKFPRYRCHTGHAYTELLLEEKQTEQMEESLWISIRIMEERRNLLLNIAQRDNQADRRAAATEQTGRADELAIHIERLKVLLVSVSKQTAVDEGYK